MASLIAETGKTNQQHVMPVIGMFQKAATSDWIVLDGYKGVLFISAHGTSIAANLAETVPTYGVATITATETATSTEVVIGTGTVTRIPPYYVLSQSGEVLEVISETAADNATSTWTVRRGCLGTTASATGLAATNVVSILNMVVFPANCLGATWFVFYPLPNDPKAVFFG